MDTPEMLGKFHSVAAVAFSEGALIVSDFQKQSHTTGAEVKPGDKTLVTAADKKCGQKIRDIILAAFPDITINAEDTANKTGSSDFMALIDPVDGTRALTIGMRTSTIIIALYSISQKQVVYCLIGEPATGRYWHTAPMSPRTLACEPTENLRECTVWPGKIGGQAAVFIDVQHKFSRRGLPMLTDDNMAKLNNSLCPTVKICSTGSNGLNHALVANGCNGVAGAITTAIGGPWDIAGVKLVLDAGGAAKAWRLDNNRQLVGVDPLNVLEADFLISGNNEHTVTCLMTHLNDCLK